MTNQTQRQVRAVEAKIKSGSGVEKAIKDVGMSRGTYYNYKARARKTAGARVTPKTRRTKKPRKISLTKLKTNQGREMLQEIQGGKGRYLVLVSQDVSILRELFQNAIN